MEWVLLQVTSGFVRRSLAVLQRPFTRAAAPHVLQSFGTPTERYGDSPLWMIVPGLLEKRPSIFLDGLSLFVAVDKCAVVKIGDLEKRGAVFREGADELILRTHEEGCFAYKNMGATVG